MKLLLLLLTLTLFSFSCKQPVEVIPEVVTPISLFYDNVESGVKDWVADSPWLIVGGYSYTLTHSWAERNGNYLSNSDYSLTSRSFDFIGYKDIKLTFWHAFVFEENYDFGLVEYSIDNGTTWIIASLATGEKYYWSKTEVNLPVENEQEVKIRFRVLTDSTNNYPGWFIDEISITGNR